MKDYPNEEALRKAHRIYLDAMRKFVVRCLKRVPGAKLEDLIIDSLDDRGVEQFEQNRQRYGSIEAAIDISDFPYIIKKHWYRDRSFIQEFDSNSKVQHKTGTIVEGRNLWAHPGTEDVDSERTRTHLSLVAEVLGEIGSEAKSEVEDIRDQLFSSDAEEHSVEAENAIYKEHLVEMSDQLEAVNAEKTELEKCLETTSKQLKEMEAEWLSCDERLKAVSEQFMTAKATKTELKKSLKATSNGLEAANAEKAKYEKALKAVSSQLATLKVVKSELEKRLETTSTRLEDVEAELATCKERLAQLEIVASEETAYEEDFAELEEHLPLNDSAPDSVTFQGTTFTKHLNEYHVEGDDISQSFWHYWQSQGREGKQEMRDAGWSVEKVDGDWEVTISPVDFQAWIENEVTELSSLINFSRDEESSTQSIRPSYEKISLPTVREMEQPALRVLADGKEHRRVEVIDYLTEHFSLTDNERSYLSKTGQSEKHLMSEGLIERTRTGYYRITARGRRKVRAA